MNAYELAEKAEGLAYEIPADWSSGEPKNVATDIANMLRQQADRIAELEKKSKPVAWMEYIQDEEWEVWYIEPTDLPEGHSYKPLYLSPQTKPLSDEEMKELINNFPIIFSPQDLLSFARAIEERHGIK